MKYKMVHHSLIIFDLPAAQWLVYGY